MGEGEGFTDPSATWRDYPYARSRGDSDGTLSLIGDCLTFSSERFGVMLDVGLDGFDSAEIRGEHEGRWQLVVHYLDGKTATFWTSKKVADGIIDAVKTRTE